MKKRVGKYSKVKDFMRTKIFIVIIIVLILMGFLIGRLIYINTEKGETYAKRVLSQQITYVNKSLPYQRGTIYDRNGIALARSVKVYNVILDPKVVLTYDYYVEPTLDALVDIFGFDRPELEKTLEEKKDSSYVVLRKQESFDKVNAFNQRVEEDHKEKKYINGVWFEEEYLREYPAGSLASHVIGFTNKGNAGAYGIEQYYNDRLNGTDGKEYGYYDSELNAQTTVREPKNGEDIISTIDYNIQSMVEKHVDKFRKDVGCNNIGVIVMDPNNGEVLAMACNEEFDLNDPRNLSAVYSEEQLSQMTDEQKTDALYKLWRNFCVSSTYEPGSTFKTITVAAAMDEGVITENSTFECKGFEEIGGWHISCNNTSGHGNLTLAESLMKSCNCALMNIAGRLGSEQFYRYEQVMGFGRKTGIDLVGEESGIIIKKENLHDTELATSSFGTTFNVTMVQMAAAYCSILNGGYYYRPHVVKKILDGNGTCTESFDNELRRMTVSKETTGFIRRALYHTVEEGTAKPAKVEGYLVGGKTGTAQKRPREEKRYVVSFAGAVPANDPEIIIYVVIDEVHDEELAGSSQPATQLTSEILTDILPYAGIYPEGGINYEALVKVIPDSEKDIKAEAGDDEDSDGLVVKYDPALDESNPDVLPEGLDEDEGP